jgi:hypothetical protein
VSYDPSKKFIFQCSCHDFHFMSFEWWPSEGTRADVTAEAYLAIGGRDWDSWKRRFKGIWGILRGRDYGYYEMVVTHEDGIRLRNALNDYLSDSKSEITGV